MSEPYEFIRVQVDDAGVALLIFDRPETRNAMHLPMNLEIRAALADLAGQGDVRVLILTGAGDRAFVSGADIAELRDRTGEVALAQHNARLCDAIEAFPHPTIAAVRGYALGGGCEVAMACDLRVAGEGARFGQPEVSLGIIPAAGGTWRLPRLVGMGKAKELVFAAAIIDATEAERIGLVNVVTADDLVLDRARTMALAIAANSRLAVQLAKRVMNHGRESGRDAGIGLEAFAQAILYDDDEKKRRMTAFLESRSKKAKSRAAKKGNVDG